MASQDITVNDMMFCKRHGSEHCPQCTCDYRETNNDGTGLDDALDELIEETGFDLIGRTPLNAYDLGAVRSRTKDVYKCSEHGRDDCGRCFNWEEIVRKEILAEKADQKWLEKRNKWLDRVEP